MANINYRNIQILQRLNQSVTFNKNINTQLFSLITANISHIYNNGSFAEYIIRDINAFDSMLRSDAENYINNAKFTVIYRNVTQLTTSLTWILPLQWVYDESFYSSASSDATTEGYMLHAYMNIYVYAHQSSFAQRTTSIIKFYKVNSTESMYSTTVAATIAEQAKLIYSINLDSLYATLTTNSMKSEYGYSSESIINNYGPMLKVEFIPNFSFNYPCTVIVALSDKSIQELTL